MKLLLRITIVFLLLLAGGCAKKAEEYTVKKVDFDYTILANFTVAYPEPYDITAASGGDIIKISAAEGGIVKKGSPLIDLDDFSEKQNLSISEANLNDAKIKLMNAREQDLPALKEQLKADSVALEEARKNLERSVELAKSETITRSELEQSENRFKTAETKYAQTKLKVGSFSSTGQEASLLNQIELFKAKVEIDRKNLAERHFKAPYDCMVLKLLTRTGEKVKPGAKLMTILERADWVLETDVDQKELPYLKPGLDADVSFDAYPSDTVKAKVSYVCAAVDSSKGTCDLKLVIKEAKPFIRHGMTGNTEIHAGAFSGVLAVPPRFVDRQGQDAFVLLKGADGVKRVPVKAAQIGEKYCIIDGVPEGSVLISK